MRPTTVLSFFAASMAVLSQSPAVYAAPIPTGLDSAGTKRGCGYIICRVAELPTTSDDSQSSMLTLVTALIDTLTSFKDGLSPTNTTTTELGTAALAPIPVIDVVEPVAAA